MVTLAEFNNTRGAQDMGLLPDTYAGYTGMAAGQFAGKWGENLPEKAGLNTVEMLDAAGRGALKALFVLGANPAVAFPDGQFAQAALEKVEFLVVQDMFLTPTAAQADVVLPAASFAEKDGTFTNIEGRVQRVRRALEPLGDARPDWHILTDLAHRMGHSWLYLTPQEIAREIAGIVPLYRDLNYRVLDLPLSSLLVSAENGRMGEWENGRSTAASTGSPILPLTHSPTHPSRDYPFVLHAGQMLFHSGTLSAWAPEMVTICAQATLEMAPADAEQLGVSHGERVRLVSPKGDATVQVHLQPNALPGTLVLPKHFAEPAVNRLLDRGAAVDRVRVEKL